MPSYFGVKFTKKAIVYDIEKAKKLPKWQKSRKV